MQTVDAERYGFLFVAEGTATVNGETLGAGDAIRFHGIRDITAAGNAELVLWDVVGTDVRLEDA